MKLPVDYNNTSYKQRKLVREEYVRLQNGVCWFCKAPLESSPPKIVTNHKIKWELFPENFLKSPVHLQHNHNTGLTEGAVHAYCNAVLWQYHGR